MNFLDGISKNAVEIFSALSSISVTTYIIAAVIVAACVILCSVITKHRDGLTEDVVLTAFFGLIFNVFALLLVLFRKPVWNNLGWIPVVAAWFFVDSNPLFAFILCVYAIIWAFVQHSVLERIVVVEE